MLKTSQNNEKNVKEIAKVEIDIWAKFQGTQ